MLTDTPCIGVCSTIYGDMVCRGCKRFYDEIIDWNSYSDEEKLTVLSRLNQLYETTLSQFLIVVDATLLQRRCQRFNVKIRAEFTPYFWAYQLLREGAEKIQDICKYGIMLKQRHTDLKALYRQIDDQLFAAAIQQQALATVD
jgi:predicted Fe-S protein YdhL (DUF1289 family)